MKIRLTVLVTLLAANGIGFTAPASSGCETQPFAVNPFKPS